jgi:hypothetical protein
MTSTLVACGFLVGKHPENLCHDVTEEGLKISLDVNMEQLAQTVSFPLKADKPARFAF